jgi:hypothetical protein
MKKIKLTQGKFALVDDEDFEYLNQFHWSVDGSGYPQRATRINDKPRPIRMHRDILKLVGSETADHKDLDKLNNQRENLRRCTKKDNNRNRGLLINNKSGFAGVYFSNEKWRRQKWVAEIHVNDKKINLGRFYNRTEAIEAYNQAALKYFGEFARLNKIA